MGVAAVCRSFGSDASSNLIPLRISFFFKNASISFRSLFSSVNSSSWFKRDTQYSSVSFLSLSSIKSSALGNLLLSLLWSSLSDAELGTAELGREDIFEAETVLLIMMSLNNLYILSVRRLTPTGNSWPLKISRLQQVRKNPYPF
ncbi:hypothetical protein WN66_01439 [Saccharomyces cerevisiae]|nr:hypothetical protein WN66_01439 [Saccharomyces cerevisiae]